MALSGREGGRSRACAAPHRAVAGGSAPALDEQLPTLHTLRLGDRGVRKQHDAVDLAGRGLDRRFRSRPASEAGTHHRDSSRTRLTQVPHGSQHVEVDSVIARVRPRSALGLTPPTEVDGQDAESRSRKRWRLRRPTLLGEPAAVRQPDASIALAVHIGVDDAPVLRGK